MLRYLKFGHIILSLILITACQVQNPTNEEPQRYLFLGHSYDWLTENRLDPRLEGLDYSKFDGVWLGGDVCARSSKDLSTIHYLDSIFDLSDSSTHWTLGNHDIMEGDRNRITDITQRPSYYSYSDAGLQILVINTNLFWHNAWDPAQENCEEKENQLAFIKHFCDTLSSARQLIVLHHHGIFNEKKINKKGELMELDNINAIPIRSTCDPQSNLTENWYPHLIRVKERGIGVHCIAGDVGMISKKYHFLTSEGIHLLGSGINNSMDMNSPAPYVKNFNPDSVLILSHWLEKDSLGWQFVRLNDLLADHRPELINDSLTQRMTILLDRY